ncbi:hypothetical protein HUG10_07535 [Halorarum halophilum]|uniref:Uncharacterized protein n=1 Tax=Halorarum halophilum TaxID=2743090 RepID=A0A7D5GEJ2_9EURY|nr:hypothetical protein [Halobaculum halophilum]QLG27408.1 hypothetical protein HUG10_07535 [Halobaculum halophilum]
MVPIASSGRATATRARADQEADGRALPHTTDTQEVTLRIAAWDETENTPPGEQAEVWIKGTGSWFPDFEFGGDLLEDAGPFVRNSDGELFIYPDGREAGTEIVATVYFDENFISNSPRDMVRIDIHDERVVVGGSPIERNHGEYELVFER